MRFMKNKNKKLKQVEIARMVKISPSFLSEIISNKKRPSWHTANRLEKVTGIPVQMWMEGMTEQIRKRIRAQ